MTTPFLLQANAFNIPLVDKSVSMVVTSPPYFGLRNYQVADQIGLEATPEEFISAMVAVFREVWRVLHPSGTVWLNLGDSYAGSGGAGGDYAEGGLKAGQPKYKSSMKIDRGKRNSKRWGGGNVPVTGNYKPKDLMMIPARVALALQADGWWLRSDIIWSKPNPMPESVTDRPTKSHEHIFLLTKRARYFFDKDAIGEAASPDNSTRNRDTTKLNNTPGRSYMAELKTNQYLTRNRRDVWVIPTHGYPGSHFATFPPELSRICIKAGSSKKGNCPNCKSPWERMVEKKFEQQNGLTITAAIRGAGNQKPMDESSGWDGVPRGSSKIKTIGWKPTCKCYYPNFSEWKTVPAIVLDPFGGAATTALVARELGCNSVMLDLSAEYIKLQKERLGITALDEWVNGKPTTHTASFDGLPWFGMNEE